MVSVYFGLPGCGKTSLIAYQAKRESLRMRKGRSPFKQIYTNVHLTGVPYVTYIDNDYIGKYNLSQGLILIDEATIFADSRDYKAFSKAKVQFFMLHRHYGCELRLFTQQWDGIDKKIRTITDKVFYIYKPLITGIWFTKYYRIPYGIIIPDKKKNKESSGSSLGEIIQGYCKPSIFTRITCPRVFRPPLYKIFDSWEAPVLDPLPDPPKQLPPDRRKGIDLLLLISALKKRRTSEFVLNSLFEDADHPSNGSSSSEENVQYEQNEIKSE